MCHIHNFVFSEYEEACDICGLQRESQAEYTHTLQYSNYTPNLSKQEFSQFLEKPVYNTAISTEIKAKIILLYEATVNKTLIKSYNSKLGILASCFFYVLITNEIYLPWREVEKRFSMLSKKKLFTMKKVFLNLNNQYCVIELKISNFVSCVCYTYNISSSEEEEVRLACEKLIDNNIYFVNENPFIVSLCFVFKFFAKPLKRSVFKQHGLYYHTLRHVNNLIDQEIQKLDSLNLDAKT